MRTVTSEIVRAFCEYRRRTIKNTSTNGEELYLHGNSIAAWGSDGDLYLTLAGWGSVTTRERLNGLCDHLFGRRPFHQRDHRQFFDDVEIGTHEVIRVPIDCSDPIEAASTMLLLSRSPAVRDAA